MACREEILKEPTNCGLCFCLFFGGRGGVRGGGGRRRCPVASVTPQKSVERIEVKVLLMKRGSPFSALFFLSP